MTAASVGPGSVSPPRSLAGAGGSGSASCGRVDLTCHGQGVAFALHGRGAFAWRARVEELDGRARHHRADGVLVDELGVPVPAEQHGEVVEPGDDPLELHPVDQEDGHGRLAFANVVQEHVLHVLGLLGGHGAVLLLMCGLPSWGSPARPQLPAGEGALARRSRCAASAWPSAKAASGAALATPPSCSAFPSRTAAQPAARAACMSSAVSPTYQTAGPAGTPQTASARRMGAGSGLSASASPAPTRA